MKLIKINSEHYIIVDDLEIKIGNWVLDVYDNSIKLISNTVILPLDKDYWKKITHSTQSLDNRGYWASCITHMPLQEVKELIGEVDVENKAEEKYPKSEFWVGSNPSRLYNENAKERRCFIEGYNQALEDNKNKKYTEEDIVNAYRLGIEDSDNVRLFGREKIVNDFKKELSKSINEWEVEFINGQLKLK